MSSSSRPSSFSSLSSFSPKIEDLSSSSPLGILSPCLFACPIPSISPPPAILRSSSLNPLAYPFPFISGTRYWSRSGSDYEVGGLPEPALPKLQECDPLLSIDDPNDNGNGHPNCSYMSFGLQSPGIPGSSDTITMEKADADAEYTNIDDVKLKSRPVVEEYDPLLSLDHRYVGNYINFGLQSPSGSSLSLSSSSRSRTMEKAESEYANIDDVKLMGEIENGVEDEDEEIKSYFNSIDHDHDYYKKSRGVTKTDDDKDGGTKTESETETTADTDSIDDDAKYYNPDFVLFWGLRKNGSNPDKPYACPVPGCVKAYNHRNGMKYHAKYFHSAPQRFNCTLCRKSYSTRTGQLQHHRRVHNPSNPKKQKEKDPIKIKTKKPIKMKTIKIKKYIVIEQSYLTCHSQKTSGPIPIAVPNPKVDKEPRNQEQLKLKNHPEIMIIEKADTSKYYNYGENDDDELVIDMDFN